MYMMLAGLKMSKSLKNFIPIRALLLDHDADDFRVFCLQHRYSANVDYRCVHRNSAVGSSVFREPSCQLCSP
jgi:cysteinyl-tRNA synthetase